MSIAISSYICPVPAAAVKKFDDHLSPSEADIKLRDFILKSTESDLLALSDRRKIQILILLNESELDDETRTLCLTRLYNGALNFSAEWKNQNKKCIDELAKAIFPLADEWEKDWNNKPESEKLRIAELLQTILLRKFSFENENPPQIVQQKFPAKNILGGYSWAEEKIILNTLNKTKSEDSRTMKFFEFMFALVNAGFKHIQNLKSKAITRQQIFDGVNGKSPLNVDEALTYMSLRAKCYVEDSGQGPITPINKEARIMAQYFKNRLEYYKKNLVYVK